MEATTEVFEESMRCNICGTTSRPSVHKTSSPKCFGTTDHYYSVNLPDAAKLTRNDPVNHPSHYTNSNAKCVSCSHPIECIDVTRHMNFNLGNAVKYLWRADLKGLPLQDLEKAVWYIKDEIMKRQGSS